MRLHLHRVAGFALLFAALAGCGSSSTPPPDPLPSVTDFAPMQIDLESPVNFTATGTRFEPVGRQAIVIFTAVTGTPFVGGTLASIEVTGNIVSETEIEGTIALPGVANPVDVVVHVRLDDGTKSTPLAATVNLMDSSLDPAVVIGPARFLDENGDGMANAGDAILLTFDREVVVDAAANPADFTVHPATDSIGNGSVEPTSNPNEVRIVLGAGATLKSRHVFDALNAGPNAPTGIELTPVPGNITNVAGKDPAPSGVLDIVPAFAAGQLLENGDTRAVALGDFTGDGWLDAVAVDFLGAHSWYANNGAGLLGARLDLEIVADLGNPMDDIVIANFTVAVAAGDLDGDGDLDLVLGRNGGGNWVVANEGGGVWRRIASLGLGDTRDIALGDLDRDGDLDIVFANAGGGSRIWRNNLPANFDESLERLDSGFVSEAVALADIDRDGDLDIVLGNVGEANTVWLNATPKGGEIDFEDANILMGGRRTFDLAVGDVDNDGDLDVVAANHEAPAQVWLNDPDGSTFTAGAELGSRTNDARNIVLDDVDGDGDLDAILGTAFAGTNVWLNDGTGSFADSGQRFGDGRVRGLVKGDLDKDGDQDLLAGNAGSQDRIWESSLSGTWGAALFASPGVLPLPPDWTAAIAAWGAVEGRVDWIATGNTAGCNALWQDVNGTLEFAKSLGDAPARAIAVGDLDGDGIPEAAIVHPDGVEIRWSDDTRTDLVSGDATYRDVAIANVAGDASLDVITARDADIRIWVNDGAGGLALDETLDAGADHLAVGASDFNGDGAIDVIAGHADGVSIWASPFTGGRVDLSTSDPVHSVLGFNVDGDLYGTLPQAADSDASVAADATLSRFTHATGWDTTPSVNDVITVTGFTNAANNGTFTVSSADATQIVVTGGALVDETAGASVTIEWIAPANTPIHDIVAATLEDVVVWFNTLTDTTAGDPTFGGEFTLESSGTTGVAAGISGASGVVTASRTTGTRFWTWLGASFSAADTSPGPYAGDVAGGMFAGRSSILVAQSGVGHEIADAGSHPFGPGRFAYGKGAALFLDLDRDGDIDIVRTEPSGENRFWRNDAGTFVDAGTVGFGFAEAADIDLDGDLDLLTAGSHMRGLQVWKNDGAGGFTPAQEYLQADVVRGVRFADLDRDGCPELIAMTGSAVKILEDPDVLPGDNYAMRATIPLPPGATALEVGHINRDTLPDLAIATAAGIIIFTNLGTDFAPGDFIPLGDARSVALADIDGDNDTDIVAGGRGTVVGVWRNTGSGAFPTAPNDTLVPNAWTEALALRDIDADGFPELFVGVFGGANLLLRNDGGTFAAPEAAPGGFWTNGLALADIDHDGDFDLFPHSKEDTGTPAPSTND